jgi:hypothetical protein
MYSLLITTICVANQGGFSSMTTNSVDFVTEEEADVAFYRITNASHNYYGNAKVDTQVIKLY